MRRYYPDYTGREKWLVVSDLCRGELERRYPHVAAYAPYVQITRTQAYAILKSEAEERRSRKRAVHYAAWTDEGASSAARRLRWEAVQRAHVMQRRRQEAQEVRAAVGQLPPVMKRRVELYYFKGFGMQEIAQREGVSTVTVYKSIARAQDALREILETAQTDPEQRLLLQNRIRGEIDRVIPERGMHRGQRHDREQAVRLNLCTVCRRMILEEGTCRLRRMDPYDRPKERCDVCRTRAGCMHLVTRHGYNAKSSEKREQKHGT